MEATTMVDWMLDTEDRLREMLDHGLLTERHTVEFKAKLDQGRGANKEHARDLAQSGPDGGVLVVGVDDGQLTPMELAGQHERIDQIARSSRYTCASRRSPPQASPARAICWWSSRPTGHTRYQRSSTDPSQIQPDAGSHWCWSVGCHAASVANLSRQGEAGPIA
jgi:hypothetical protein